MERDSEALNTPQCIQVYDCFQQFLESRDIVALWNHEIINTVSVLTKSKRQQFQIDCYKDSALEKYFVSRGIEGFIAKVDSKEPLFVTVIFNHKAGFPK